jgi:hypothetical protein
MYIEETNRIEHVIWMTSWQRRQALRYGDVVIFDPTYNTNDQRLPNSHFTCVDNTMRSLEVCQALHLDEKTSTFVWLFSCYLEAARRMKTLYTDQDGAIAAAAILTEICEKHRLCLWHILMNMTKHLAKVLGRDFDALRNAIVGLASGEYGNSEATWELEWTAMLDKFENITGENKPLKYLHDLYKVRKQWARVFQYGVIDLNIRTTQRGESINAHTKLFLTRQTTMYQVRQLAHQEFEVERRKIQDTRAAYEMYCNVNAAHPQAWYKAIAGVITSTVLKLIDKQMELANTSPYDLVERVHPENGNRLIDVVTTTSGATRTVTFATDTNIITHCTCSDFSAMGYPCRHICRVMIVNGQGSAAASIGPECLNKRWERDVVPDRFTYVNEVRDFDNERRAFREANADSATSTPVLNPEQAARQRFADMSNISKKLFSLIVQDEAACDAYITAVENKIAALTICGPVPELNTSSSLPSSSASSAPDADAAAQRVIGNPSDVKAPGRKKKRMKSSLEVASSMATTKADTSTRMGTRKRAADE